jgi:hypothetical protein
MQRRRGVHPLPKAGPRNFDTGTIQITILATGPGSKLKVTDGRAHSVIGSEFDGVPLSQMISEIQQYR